MAIIEAKIPGVGPNPPKWQVGHKYVTKGGWEAEVIWVVHRLGLVVGGNGFYAVHKPNGNGLEESVPIWHDDEGKAGVVFSVNEAPTYNGHPADLTPP